MNKGFIIKFQQSKYFKSTTFSIVVLVLVNLFIPQQAYAITDGAGQSEFTSFSQASTTDMVDPYSGDFNYNIPLLSVPGPNGSYPVNLSYQSGITMDQEASWVGLGWNVNVGAVNRQLRGIPDDFQGDNIVHTMHIKPTTIVSYHVPYHLVKDLKTDNPAEEYKRIFGIPPEVKQAKLNLLDRLRNASLDVYYHSQRGVGIKLSANVMNSKDGNSPISGDVSFDTQGGLGADINTNFKYFSGSVSLQTGQGVSGFRGGVNYITPKVNYKKASGKIGGSTSLSFGVNQNVPGVSIPMVNTVIPFKLRFAKATTFGLFKAEGFQLIYGYVHNSKVANKGKLVSKSYGYSNIHKSSDNTDMVDVTRSEINYSKHVPNLAPSFLNHDIYTYSGQGTGGVFRPYQTSILTVGDREQVSNTNTYSGTIELGLSGTLIHADLGLTIGSGENKSGKWKTGINGISTNSTIRGYQAVYYKDMVEMAGDLTIHDEYELWKKSKAYRLKVVKTNDNWLNEHYEISNDFITSSIDQDNTLQVSTSNITKSKRKPRGKHIQVYSYQESKNVGFSRHISNFEDVKNSNIPEHHTAEIEVTQEDGMRYIYALPAYVKKQVEVVSSVKAEQSTNLHKVVDLKSDSYMDKSTDQYLSKKELPPYAHSWMLSYVVSSDYIDVNQNGPDNADNGYWVKFNYQKKSDNYKWRTPFKGASYLEGNLSDKKDDKAMFTYGEKQLYYLESIVTKTHTAIFKIEKREDGIQANDEYVDQVASLNTANDTGSLFKLLKIHLYTNEEYKRIQKLGNEAIGNPLKSVHFDYDYELCKSVQNNSQASTSENVNKGKLTLRKLYFTYQNSKRGALSPYTFHYENNLTYAPSNTDRWGNYKENVVEGGTLKYPSHYEYSRFPYSDQEFDIINGKKVSKTPISTWTLNKIDLPSGGTFQVEYESDDYAYVEDKKATRMYDIIGVGSESIGEFTNRSSGRKAKLTNDSPVDRRLYFKLEEHIDYQLLKLTKSSDFTVQLANTYFKENYLTGQDKIWYKTLVKIKDKLNTSDDIYDVISGYVPIDETDCGVMADNNGNYTIGYVRLDEVKLNEKGVGNIKVHPITKQAIQFLQLERGELINDNSAGTSLSDKNALEQVGTFAKQIVSVIPNLIQVLTGFNIYAYSTLSTGDNIVLGGNTVIKLQDSDGIKFGGGVRVKRISLTDNWVNGSTADASSYGQEYDYSIEENGRIISSGVAYEPSVGAEESALRTPVTYSESTPLSTTKSYFVENPILEGYYPAPSVGYRKVSVRSIAPSEAKKDKSTNNLFSSMAPITVYEYYTAKEFPVIASQTDLSMDNTIRRPIMIPFAYTAYKKHVAKSQGYSIILNDMAGKLKSVSTYTRNASTASLSKEPTLISSKRYNYLTKLNYDDSKVNELSNEVDVYVPNSTGGIKLGKANIGQTIDFFVDQNQRIETSQNRGGELNADITLPTGIPFFVLPMVDISDNEMTERFSVSMKIIHRKGILKEVIETTEKSIIKTENVVYDQLTSEALLTKVTNEFRDPIYSMKFPGHWYYKSGIGPVYERQGVAYEGDLNMIKGELRGFPWDADLDTYFTIGDELYVESTSGSFLAHVVGFGLGVKLVTETGLSKTVSSVTKVTIVHPSSKNNIQLAVGSLTFKDYSLSGTGSPEFNSILNSSAITLTDQWSVPCVLDGLTGKPSNYFNPYIIGKKGIYRTHKTYTYMTDRNYANKIKQDGTYTDFKLFPWQNPTTKSQRWVESTESTMYSKLGYPIESKNALQIYSSSLYGYDQDLPVAVASNARFKEIGFDGFEDYSPSRIRSHFGFQRYQLNISSNESHSGRKSIRVASGESLKMKKMIGTCEPSVLPDTGFPSDPGGGNEPGTPGDTGTSTSQY